MLLLLLLLVPALHEFFKSQEHELLAGKNFYGSDENFGPDKDIFGSDDDSAPNLTTSESDENPDNPDKGGDYYDYDYDYNYDYDYEFFNPPGQTGRFNCTNGITISIDQVCLFN